MFRRDLLNKASTLNLREALIQTNKQQTLSLPIFKTNRSNTPSLSKALTLQIAYSRTILSTLTLTRPLKCLKLTSVIIIFKQRALFSQLCKDIYSTNKVNHNMKISKIVKFMYKLMILLLILSSIRTHHKTLSERLFKIKVSRL